MGFWVQGSRVRRLQDCELQGFRVAGFRVLGFGFGASVLDVRVQGLPGFKVFLLGAFVTLFGETTKPR